MLNRIITFSVRNKLIIGLLTLGLILHGAREATRLPIDAVPDITNNQIQVITNAPSYGATDIERLVTFPVEQACNNIPGLLEIRSFSRFGLSLVTIVFEDDVDIYWARQQVAERMQQVKDQIPADIKTPTLGPVSTGLGEIYQYVVKPKKGYEHKFDATELRTIQDWYVRRQLLGVKGVAEVSSFGGKLKQYAIAVDPQKLQSHHVTIQDIYSALASNNQNTGGSYIEKGPTVLYIRSEGLLKSKEDISQIPIKKSSSGVSVLIKDVADVEIGFATRYGALCFNNDGEVAGAVVMMLKGANSNNVIKDVKAKIANIKKNLPEGVEIEAFLDRTKMVNNAIGTVEKNLLEGALIVVFVLVIFLGNFRAGLLVASVIPLAMLFAIIMMNAFGVSGNLMSLGALDFGLIVDGAVIIVEAVLHQMAHRNPGLFNQKEMDHEIKHTSGKMMNSAVFGQIIILIVYLPIFSLEGIEGKMFKPMAQTVAFALLGAFLLSLTYIPMMSSIFLNKRTGPSHNWSDRMMAVLEKMYVASLEKALKIPKIVIGLALSMFVVAVIVLSQMGGEFIPALEEGDFAVETRVMSGSNLQTTIAESQKAVKILRANFPEIEKVVTKIGSGEVPTDPMPIDAADMMIILKPKSEWTSATTFNELAEKMRKSLEVLPGLSVGFQYPVQMRFNELMTGAKQDVVCKIFGDDLDSLTIYAEKMSKIIQGIDGATDIYVEPVEGLPQVVIDYNRKNMSVYGLSVETVNNVVNTAFAGQAAGLVYEGEKRFDAVVRLKSDKRSSIDDVKNLLIPTSSGTQIPLYMLADVSLKSGPGQIQRIDTRRRIVVGFNVRNRDVQSIVEELQSKVDKSLSFAPGYYPTYGGAFENLNHAKDRLMFAVPLSLLLILFLLYMAFGSLNHALLIYSAIPLSAIGGVFFLALRGMPFSISAGVGFIALFGVAVLNGLVLIAEFRRLQEQGIENIHEVVVKGSRMRLRPVLMTALVASLGFLPMAMSNGAGAEVQRPLATVVIGGLMIATLLTLIVLPILYIIFERHRIKRKKGKIVIEAFVLIPLMFAGFNANSQQVISLHAALDSAKTANLQLKSSDYQIKAAENMKKTAIDLPGTKVNTNYGQFNSKYNDLGFSITQDLEFPVVYGSKKNLLNEKYETALLNKAMTQKEVDRDISMLYFDVINLKVRKQLFLELDSLYGSYIAKAESRILNGESNQIERISLNAKRNDLRIKLQATETELAASIRLFHQLIHTTALYEPPGEYPKLTVDEPANLRAELHPSLLVLASYKKEQELYKSMLRAGLFPALSIGYSNNSITGTGADNIVYTRSDRFQSVQAGISIPLFYGASTNRIKAADVQIKVAENQYQWAKESYEINLENVIRKMDQLKTMVQHFETVGLKESDVLKATANLQYDQGSLAFTDWTVLISQAYDIRLSYLETLKNYHQSISELKYYESNK